MTAISQIIDWANKESRPIWWKHAIRILLQEPHLETCHYELMFNIAKKEAGFLVELPEYEIYKEDVSSHGFGIEDVAVRLLELGPVSNISSLGNDQSIRFQKNGMTIIYGDNGTGKSSYAKILKNACLTRGDRPDLIGNVFEPSSGNSCSKITYQVGDNDRKEVDWVYAETDIAELKSIRVFDTKSAFHYVEREDVLSYRPAGLHLLDALVTVCDFVRSEVDKSIAAKQRKVIGLPTVAEDTDAGQFLKNLSYKTTPDELDRHCITKQEEKILESTTKEIALLKTKTIDEIKKGLVQKIALLKPLKNDLEKILLVVEDNAIGKIKAAKKDLDEKAKTSEVAREKTFLDLPIEQVGSPVWKTLWASAKDFIGLLDDKSFPPKEGDVCPLCLQTISGNASNHMTAFEEFIENDIQKQVMKKKDKYEEKIKIVESSEIDLELHKAAILELKEVSDDIDERIGAFVEIFDTRKQAVLNNSIGSEQLPVFDRDVIEFIDNFILEKSNEIKGLKASEDVDVLIKTKETLEKNLTAKKMVRDFREQIVSEVKRLKSISAYQNIRSQTNSRQITGLASTISEVYLTNSLKENFADELNRFGFRSFKVDAATRNRGGAQLFKIKLADTRSTKVHTIASEGEQKCLAMASIFAELRSDARRSCVIFDDPVNSLDHRWRFKVAKRLIEESMERQVVVFTHDIVFLKFLIEASESFHESTELEIMSLDRSQKETGIVKTNPPWDALPTGKRIKILKTVVRDLKRIWRDKSESEYADAVGRYYGLLREAWERLVEEKLLNKVVERFGRGIQTQRLRRLVDISDADIAKVDAEMSKCSCYFEGHDSAPRLQEDIPSIEEIEESLNTIDAFAQELSSTRKRS